MVPTDRYTFLTENLDLPAASGVDDAQWEHFQVAHLCDDSTFRIEDKSRQVAWSFTAAMEAIAEALLEKQSSIFVSINLDEASEKIRYARTVLENLYQPFKFPKLIRDNQLQLEFDNGARLISLPSRPPRGKARMNIYIDEFCHLRGDREIYSAALPIITKGGRLRIGSSLMGESGQHWEISQQKIRPYPGYTRSVTPWWKVWSFCKDPIAAYRMAPQMTTFQRVEMFGNDRIKAIYSNMIEEDFRREYECVYVDEASAWITWDEIRQAQALGDGLNWIQSISKGTAVDNAKEAIDQLVEWRRKRQVELFFAAGVDVGRTRNTTELIIVGRSSTQSLPLRCRISLDGTPFDEQFDVLDYTLRKLPIIKMYIDRNGIGRNLAENLETKHPVKAEGYDFTASSKTLLATNAKQLVQQNKAPLPTERDISYQIHSIKRKVTASNNMVFDVDRNEKHHADIFWGWALALTAGNQDQKIVRTHAG